MKNKIKPSSLILRRKGRQVLGAEFYQVVGTLESADLAAVVVNAVNAHAGIVGALRDALSELDDACDESEDINGNRSVGKAIKTIQAALRAAGEEV